MPSARPTDLPPNWNPPDSNVDAPSAGKMASGFAYKEPLASKTLNWLFRSVGKWVTYLASQDVIAPVLNAAGWKATGLGNGAGLHGVGGPVAGTGVRGTGTGAGLGAAIIEGPFNAGRDVLFGAGG